MNNIYKKVVFVFFSMTSVAYGAAAQEAEAFAISLIDPYNPTTFPFPKVTEEHEVKMLEEIYKIFTNSMNLHYFSSEAARVTWENYPFAVFDEVFPGWRANSYTQQVKTWSCDFKNPDALYAMIFIKSNISHFSNIFSSIKGSIKHEDIKYGEKELLARAVKLLNENDNPLAKAEKESQKKYFVCFAKEVVHFVCDVMREHPYVRKELTKAFSIHQMPGLEIPMLELLGLSIDKIEPMRNALGDAGFIQYVRDLQEKANQKNAKKS